MSPAAWMLAAACADAEDDLVTLDVDLGRELAERHCSTCPVVGDCLAFGTATSSTGVWGGRVLLLGRPARKARDATAA